MNINKISSSDFTSALYKAMTKKSDEKIQAIKDSLMDKTDEENES